MEFKNYTDSTMLKAGETMGYYDDKPDKNSDDFVTLVNFINTNFRNTSTGNSHNDDK